MLFDANLYEDMRDGHVTISDDGLTATMTCTSLCAAFAQPELSSGQHVWEVTLGDQGEKPGYCCIGVGDASCGDDSKYYGFIPVNGKFHSQDAPRHRYWRTGVDSPIGPVQYAGGARIRVMVDMDNRTLSFAVDGGRTSWLACRCRSACTELLLLQQKHRKTS